MNSNRPDGSVSPSSLPPSNPYEPQQQQQQQHHPSPEIQFQRFQQEAFRIALGQHQHQQHQQPQSQGSGTQELAQQIYPTATSSRSRHGSVQSVHSNESIQQFIAVQQQQQDQSASQPRQWRPQRRWSSQARPDSGVYDSGLVAHGDMSGQQAVVLHHDDGPISHGGQAPYQADSQQFGQVQQHHQSQAHYDASHQQPQQVPPPRHPGRRRERRPSRPQYSALPPGAHGPHGPHPPNPPPPPPLKTHENQVQAHVSGLPPPLLPPDVGDQSLAVAVQLPPHPHPYHPHRPRPSPGSSHPHHNLPPNPSQLLHPETYVHPPQTPPSFGDHAQNPSPPLVLPPSTTLSLAYDPSTSSFMSAQVAALNAQQFGDAIVSTHNTATSMTDMAMARKTSLSATDAIDDGASTLSDSRKRSRLGEEHGPTNDDEERKRTRGRPRLDTKDETAADRRRTQIRLAQRAYRNRKENAIQTLEKKVTELKETNEEMSNAFMKLHDFAISHGLLDAAPDFGRQLRATTEKFLSLARRSSEDVNKDDDDANNDNQETSPDSGDRRGSDSNSAQQGSESSDAANSTTTTATSTSTLLGGIIVTHEMVPSIATTTAAAATTRADYEVITQPTMENASFPYGTSASDLDGARGGYAAGMPSPFGSSMLPPLPETLGHNEITFGRRLQRTTLEQALYLAGAPGIHPELFSRVFGFCLLFESRDKIKQRLTYQLSMTTKETLHNWRFPFLQLGGSGTFLPQWQDTTRTLDIGTGRNPIGNQGTAEPFRPQNTNGFSTGPFDSVITEARDRCLGTGHRINLPGFEGDFFDADEVEFYLRQRGVVIPPLADYVTVEIDMTNFPGEHGTVPDWVNTDVFGKPATHLSFSSVSGTGPTHFGGAASDVSVNVGPLPPDPTLVNPNLFSAIAPPIPDLTLPPGDNPSSRGQGISVDQLLLSPETPITECNFGSASAESPATTAAGFSSPYYFNSTMPNNFLDAGLLSSFGARKANPSPRRVVTINVSVFINELIRHAVCLGRSPGYKPMDINNAFWIATQI